MASKADKKKQKQATRKQESDRKALALDKARAKGIALVGSGKGIAPKVSQHEVVLPGLTAAKVRAGIDIPATVTMVQRVALTVKRVQGEVMWEGALLTDAVVRAGAIGDHDGAMWGEQNDYADAIGFGPSYVTLLKLLGRAATVHGLDKGETFAYLAQRLGKGGSAKVKEAIRGDDSDAFRAAVEAIQKADATPALSGPRPPDGEPGKGPDTTDSDGSRDGAGADAPEVRKPRTLGDVRTMLAAVEEAIHGLSAASQIKAENDAVKMLARLRDRREVHAAADKATA